MLFCKKHSKPCGGSKILRIRALCGGSKPPPYFIITDISPIWGITPPYLPESGNYTVGNGLDRFEIFLQITGERSSPLRA